MSNTSDLVNLFILHLDAIASSQRIPFAPLESQEEQQSPAHYVEQNTRIKWIQGTGKKRRQWTPLDHFLFETTYDSLYSIYKRV